MRRTRRLIGTLLAAAFAWSGAASAQGEFPTKPVRMIVAFGAGGIVDVTARIIAEPMTASLKQQLIIENKPGAGSTLAGDLVAKSPPDGYTILMNGTAQPVIPALFPNATFDVFKDFQSIGQVGRVPLVLVINPALPVKDYADFIKYMKANPKKVFFGTTGVGSGAHLAGELFRRMAGVEYSHVSYRTTPLAITDMMNGQLGMMIDTHTLLGPHIKSGAMRALAVTSIERSTIFPDIPTLDQLGLKGYDSSAWTGIYAPAGVSPAVTAKLNAALRAALADPGVRKRFDELGIQGAPDPSPEYLTKLMRVEVPRWTEILKDTPK
jgi:tripartite-type tricarboxylate transporter receptor subunit TctC